MKSHTEQVEGKIAVALGALHVCEYPQEEDKNVIRTLALGMYSLGVKEGREEMRKEYDENILRLIPKLDGMGAKVDAISENLSKYKLDPL